MNVCSRTSIPRRRERRSRRVLGRISPPWGIRRAHYATPRQHRPAVRSGDLLRRRAPHAEESGPAHGTLVESHIGATLSQGPAPSPSDAFKFARRVIVWPCSTDTIERNTPQKRNRPHENTEPDGPGACRLTLDRCIRESASAPALRTPSCDAMPNVHAREGPADAHHRRRGCLPPPRFTRHLLPRQTPSIIRVTPVAVSPIDGRLVERLYRRANGARWRTPMDRLRRALEASAARALRGGVARPSARARAPSLVSSSRRSRAGLRVRGRRR